MCNAPTSNGVGDGVLIRYGPTLKACSSGMKSRHLKLKFNPLIKRLQRLQRELLEHHITLAIEYEHVEHNYEVLVDGNSVSGMVSWLVIDPDQISVQDDIIQRVRSACSEVAG